MGLTSRDTLIIKCILLTVAFLLIFSCAPKTSPNLPQPLETGNISPATSALLTADFVAIPTRGPAPLTVTFNDQSQGEINQWSWEFGDGEFGSAKQPVHTYNSIGKYTVSLTVAGPKGSDATIKYSLIEVTPEIISWEEAINYVGQSKVVEGMVVGAKYVYTSKGKPTFLNIGKPYPEPGRFTALIWGSDRGKFEAEFPPNPETYFLNKLVQVEGKVEEYAGNAEIVLHDPPQIRVIK